MLDKERLAKRLKGRPPGEATKTERLHIRVTPDELAAIHKGAKQAKMTVTAYVNYCVNAVREATE